MKRSEFVKRAQFALLQCLSATDEAVMHSKLHEAAEVAADCSTTWDPEEPEGFREWFDAWDHDGVPRIPDLEEMARLAWNACLAHQEAQERTIEPEVDPEVRRKEIEAQIASWVAGLNSQGAQPLISFSPGYLGAEVRHLLHRLRVL